jgi:1-acyl-sn-glycerol-3-phosphate acyltransferase
MFYRLSWLTAGLAYRGVFRAKVQGAEHVPRTGPAILASNHLSYLDHFLLGSSVWRQVHFISKIEHFERPVRRWLFRQWGVIPLKRGASDQEAFQRSVEVLQRGGLFAIYPEGTRSLDGKLHKGHTGVARLHLLTGAPVVPVAMLGTFEALPKGRSVPRLVKCGVRYGRPLEFRGLRRKADDRATLRWITEEIMMAIKELSGQEYVPEYQYNPEVKTHARAGNGGGAARGAADAAVKKS